MTELDKYVTVYRALLTGSYGTPSLPEVVIEKILDYACFWDSISVASQHRVTVSDSRKAYLSLEIPEGRRLRARKLVGVCESHDQGWSSYPQSQGTKKGSWTWGDLSVVDGEDKEVAKVDRVYTNIHASSEWQSHRFEFSSGDLMKELVPGRRLVLSLNAMFPGWKNNVRSARLTLYFA